jgi:hypothetical protein
VVRSVCPASLRVVTQLGGLFDLVSAGSLPNDGNVIADARDGP